MAEFCKECFKRCIEPGALDKDIVVSEDEDLCEGCGEFKQVILEYNPTKYVKQEPYVDDKGIWVPYQEYVPEGCVSHYKPLMTKEVFVEAYRKWIKGEEL